jgi:hypothetical protein
MEETKEQLFARLEAMGYEKVNEQRQRGLLAGNAIWVNEWLQNRGIARLEEAQALHRRAVYAAERAARFAMFTALIALAVVLMVVTASPAWMARF